MRRPKSHLFAICSPAAGGRFLAWHDPRLMISRRPALQLLRSSFLLGATLFAMLALKIMPLVDFSAIVWVAPVLVAALSVFILNEQVGPGLWVSVFTGLAGVWVIVGRPGMDFSFSLLFPFLAALTNALYQITTRLLHESDRLLTTLFYTAIAGVVSAGISALCHGDAKPRRCRPDASSWPFWRREPFLSHSRFCGGARQYRGSVRLHGAALGHSFSLLIFGEIPSPRTLFGAALIVGAGLFIFLRGRKI